MKTYVYQRILSAQNISNNIHSLSKKFNKNKFNNQAAVAQGHLIVVLVVIMATGVSRNPVSILKIAAAPPHIKIV